MQQLRRQAPPAVGQGRSIRTYPRFLAENSTRTAPPGAVSNPGGPYTLTDRKQTTPASPTLTSPPRPLYNGLFNEFLEWPLSAGADLSGDGGAGTARGETRRGPPIKCALASGEGAQGEGPDLHVE